MFRIPDLTLCSKIGKATQVRKTIKAEEDVSLGFHAKIENDNLRVRS